MVFERRTLWALALLGLAFFLFVWGLGDVPFYTKGEPREALQVWEEYHAGEWILPLRNGRELPSKPPLFHWLAGVASLALQRVDELSVRLPSALLATAAVVLVFWLGARTWGTLAGVYAGFILATNFEWVRAATSARVDMTLTAFLTGALVSLGVIVSAAEPPAAALAGFYACMGLAALAKGPVGLVLPPLVAVVYLAVRGDLERLRRMRVLLGGAAATAIACAWYVLAYFRGGPAFVHKHLWVENFGRFLAADSSGAGHAHPFYYFIPGFFLNFAPWSFLLIPLAVHLARNRRRLVVEGYLYPLVWFAVIFLFYSLSESKRTVYLLPAYPAAALLLGAWWKRLSDETARVPAAVLGALQAAGVMMAVTIAVALVVLVAEGYGAEPLAVLRPYLAPRDQANLPFVHAILQSRFWYICFWVAALVPVLHLFLRSVRRLAWGPVFASIVVFVASAVVVVNGVFHPALAERRTFRSFFRDIVRPTLKHEDRLYFYKAFDYGAVFYARRHIPPLRPELLDAVAPGSLAYVLLWESEWERLPPEIRNRLEPLHKSDGYGPEGRNRLLFAMVRRSVPGGPAGDVQNG